MMRALVKEILSCRHLNLPKLIAGLQHGQHHRQVERRAAGQEWQCDLFLIGNDGEKQVGFERRCEAEMLGNGASSPSARRSASWRANSLRASAPPRISTSSTAIDSRPVTSLKLHPVDSGRFGVGPSSVNPRKQRLRFGLP
jgi:hypothetical protein